MTVPPVAISVELRTTLPERTESLSVSAPDASSSSVEKPVSVPSSVPPPIDRRIARAGRPPSGASLEPVYDGRRLRSCRVRAKCWDR